MAKLGYTWYPKDWKTNEKVFNMRLELRGFYRELIDFAYENDNNFKIDEIYWSRSLGITRVKLYKLLKELETLQVIKITNKTWSIPTVEPRIMLIRGGRKGGKISKPPSKPIAKPITKPDSNQIERERESKKESKVKDNNFAKAIDLYISCQNLTTAKKEWDNLTDEDRELILTHAGEYRKAMEKADSISFLPDFNKYLFEKMYNIPIKQLLSRYNKQKNTFTPEYENL